MHVATESNRASLVPGIGRLAGVFINAFPRLNAGEQQLALALYRMLARGAPVSTNKLSQESGLSVDFVKQALARWPGVFYDRSHAVIGFWGIAVQETRHRLATNRNIAYTWCAWDALFIPELLGTSARVHSTCAETGDVVEMAVSKDGVTSRSPEGVMVSFLVPDAADVKRNVTVSFCHFVHFLRDREAGERWTARHEGTFLLTLDQAFELGRSVNHARYREVLNADQA